jgi:hypothetical protein
MTLDQWLNRVSGWQVIVPKGTEIRRGVTLEQDTTITIRVDPGDAWEQMRKALRNATGESRDGALRMKVQP